MVIGRVDEFGRALVELPVQSTSESQAENVHVWIDTGFTGELVLPQRLVEQLGLEKSGDVDASLADGSQNLLETYSSYINWFGTKRPIEVVASQAPFPLLGVGLLLGRRLIVDYSTLTVSIE